MIAAGGLATSANNSTVHSPVMTPSPLAIALVGSDRVISWPSAATGNALQQNPDLNPANWTTHAGAITDNGTTKTLTLTAPKGNLFFRLLHQ